ncbi:amino acid permease, partial [Salmonella enterica subsp. enterica serovar Infantis]
SEGGGRAVSKATLLALVLAPVLFIIVVAFAAFATGNVDRVAEGNATNEAILTHAGPGGGILHQVAFYIIVGFVCAV